MNATITNLTIRPLELTGGRMLQPASRLEDMPIGDQERALRDSGALDIGKQHKPGKAPEEGSA